MASSAPSLFLNGVATSLGHVRDQAWPTSGSTWRWARSPTRLPDSGLRFVPLLHPDPWPKARHAKAPHGQRRPSTSLPPSSAGGELRIANRPSSLSRMDADGHAAPCPAARMAGSETRRFPRATGGCIETRFGAKSRREGRRPYYLRYRRTGSSLSSRPPWTVLGR